MSSKLSLGVTTVGGGETECLLYILDIRKLAYAVQNVHEELGVALRVNVTRGLNHEHNTVNVWAVISVYSFVYDNGGHLVFPPCSSLVGIPPRLTTPQHNHRFFTRCGRFDRCPKPTGVQFQWAVTERAAITQRGY